MEFWLRNGLTLMALGLLSWIMLRDKQDAKTNWATFYATLWTTFSLGVLNYYFVEKGYWCFPNTTASIEMPYDIFFLWVVIWGVIPAYFLKGRYLLFWCLGFLWLDLLLMPQLEEWGILILADNWLIGEIVLLALVFIPAYLWAKFSYEDIQVAWRAGFQVITMILFLLLIVPFSLLTYLQLPFNPFESSPFLVQFLLIISFPALVAVYDLVTKGEGTPFPYDKTKQLVQTGVYAYCKNPIQWSFTLCFIPISLYYNNYCLLMGVVVSIAYVIGVSDPQENEDMKQRFGEDWVNYATQVPKWYFQWTPKGIPEGKIYFDQDCSVCSEVKAWFEAQQGVNLQVLTVADYEGGGLNQVTYVDHKGRSYKSVAAIAAALEHSHLAYASLAWLMRMPPIRQLLQVIINALGWGERQTNCEL